MSVVRTHVTNCCRQGGVSGVHFRQLQPATFMRTAYVDTVVLALAATSRGPFMFWIHEDHVIASHGAAG